MKEAETYYRRHLPHYQPEGETYHVVFRLGGSIPAGVMKELRLEWEKEERRIAEGRNRTEQSRSLMEYRWKYFEKVEASLGTSSAGPMWLRNPEIAAIVDEAIHYRDKKEYDLIAHSIMPNHVHMVFELLPDCSNLASGRRDGVPSYNKNVCRVADPTAGTETETQRFMVTDIIGSLKKYTALRANRILGRRGTFWQNESYDHVIRDANELDRMIWYVLMNPVKAELCGDWRNWKWSYVKEGFIGDWIGQPVKISD